ncbi:T9SS type A sorting domain-containing protein [Flavobacterium litorale]|uniref:T9SS sorting signal type C domain-containing protein n=1 Tax=Flavobacterium litorale TaxID=2856519 RepID=A0ABX8V7C8_9FLAO|nr:T9SS type A sorting domain-containing protein [Flavobacterium litorale]QYJ68402.1 hypothetical protein K1I41_00510 [Flavobacterium litorale]
MKRLLLLFITLMYLLLGKAHAQSAGFNNTFIIFSINGSLNLYYDLNAATDNYDFDGQFLGNFCQNSDNLIFKGGEHNIYKCNGCDLTSTRIYYRIYPTGSPSGTFVSNTLNYFSGYNNGCGGQDQRWEKLDFDTDLLLGLEAGNYTIEAYSDATITCQGGTAFASNGGNNYKATFTVTAASVGGTLSGNASFCSTSNSGTLTLSGNTGNVVRWESSTVSDFSASVTEIENTTTTLALANVPVTTYYRALVKNEDCTEDYSAIHTVTVNPNSWTGSVDTDWNNASNWCGGIPATTDDITIASQTNSPVIASGNNVTVASITLLSGGNITVNSGANLTVTNSVSVAADATFIVENNANLIQINDVANTGDIIVEKDSSPLYRLDYSLWASPVANQNLQDFSPLTLSNRFYSYDESTDLYASITPSGNDFEVGRGYLIRMPNNHPDYVDDSTPGTAWTGTFTGIPNNGTITVATTTSFNGYNLVGNPYPSPINIHNFFDANTGSISETSALYFWRKRNDPGTTTYALITKSAYTMNSASGGDTGSGTFMGDSSTWVINPGQGFFVEATGSSVTFNNGMRVPVNNGQFFRMQQQQESIMSRIWLNITGSNNEFKQLAIAYTNQTTLGLDYGWDGKAFINDGPIALYTIVNDIPLGIEARPQFDVTDVVPLAYKITDAGSYTISLDHFDGLFLGGQDIYLKDNVTGQTIDIKNDNYTFSTQAGVVTDRFEIVYTNSVLTTDVNLTNNSVIVYEKDGVITVNSNSDTIQDITIYDARGRLIYTQLGGNQSTAQINKLPIQQQMVIVHITTDSGMVVKKLIM